MHTLWSDITSPQKQILKQGGLLSAFTCANFPDQLLGSDMASAKQSITSQKANLCGRGLKGWSA